MTAVFKHRLPSALTAAMPTTITLTISELITIVIYAMLTAVLWCTSGRRSAEKTSRPRAEKRHVVFAAIIGSKHVRDADDAALAAVGVMIVGDDMPTQPKRQRIMLH